MSTSDISFRDVPYLDQKQNLDRRADGSILLTNGQPLKSYPRHMLAPIKHWAEHRADTLWLAQRDPVDASRAGWQDISYRKAWARIQQIAQGFINLGASGPVMILSRNSIDHALVMYGAMLAGCPVVPVTPAYALLSQDFARLNYIDDLIEPHFIYVEDGHQYQRGLDGMTVGDRPVIYSRNAPTGCNTMSIGDLAVANTGDVEAAYDALEPGTVAKYMMTSGSTGDPKAVINTHEMIAANAKMIRSVWDEERLDEICGGPQVMCNFLPWSHTYGANAILHNITDWGGTLYIDWGAPTPERLPEMLRNMREVSTTQHTTVPAAWAALATELEQDEILASTFFERLICMAYGGAAMGQDIYERIQAIAVAQTGQRISLSAGYGATETAPTASNVHWPNDTMGLIGSPLPGNIFKLVPLERSFELRVKGVNVTPGYFRNPQKTKEAFDDEGFYCLGDAVRFADEDDPKKGLAFDGRTVEEFKLANGTWVSAGKLRVQAVQATNGVLSDVVVCGLNRDDIRLLGFLNQNYCQKLVGSAQSLPELTESAAVIEAVRAGLQKHNAAYPNTSSRIAGITLMQTPPSSDAGEITEKGYINQFKVQALRSAEIERLFGASSDPKILKL